MLPLLRQGRQLTSYDGQSITYDSIGNPTNYMGADMTWFARQMQSYSKNGTNITYTYDADGLRAAKTVNGIKHEYYYVDGQLRYEKNGDSYEMYYRYDADGRPVLATKRDLVANQNYQYYLITNTRGDVIETRDGNGNVNAKYTYDSWGKLIAVTDANGNVLPETSFAHQISLRYRGYVYDNETGLYYLQSRYYDPETGRFLNADSVDYITILLTVADNANLYLYCCNNPISYEDATGYLIWPGEIHNEVIRRIVGEDKRLSKQVKIYYGNGKYGYCDILDFSSKEMWELKRFLKDPNKQLKRYNKAVEQLGRYVGGYHIDKVTKTKVDDFKFGMNRFGYNSFDDYKNYFIEYWYVSKGIIVYDYYELTTKKSYQKVTVPVTDQQTAQIFLYAIVYMFGLLSAFGGRGDPVPA